IFHTISDNKLERYKVTLILSEPNKDSTGLNPDLKKFFEDTTFKNRVMFLTGQRNSMDNLVEKGKEYTAINDIISKMKHEEKLSETDPQYQQTLDLFSKIT